jgi:glucose-1-phosphate thymidylyltransferase
LKPYCEQFIKQKAGAMVLLKKVDDPRRYGVPKLDQVSGRIELIEEKPEHPLSDYCVTGLYFYDTDVFGMIDGVKPSRRGELEITDVNNAYAQKGLLSYQELKGWWTDAGTFESLEEAGRRLKGAIS